MDNYYDNPPIVSEVPSNEAGRDARDTWDLVRDSFDTFIQDIVDPIIEAISISREDDEDDNPAYKVTDTYYDDGE